MPARKDEKGQRSVEPKSKSPARPRKCGAPGISSWFVPTTVEEREGGAAVSSYGPDMNSVAKITKWNPPQSFVAQAEEEGLGKVATEWVVEARGGVRCVVRVVHRWFASTDDWTPQFEGAAYGWAASFFRMLRLYLAYFAGQECAAFQLTASAKSRDTWRTIKSALSIDHSNGRVTSAPGAPDLVGRVEKSGAILTCFAPGSGAAHRRGAGGDGG